METKKKHELSLAKRMAISLVCGLVAGLAFMFLREHLNASGQAETWTTINNLLFQDITAEGADASPLASSISSASSSSRRFSW